MRITAGKRKHKKILGFLLEFSGPLNATTAQNVGHYHVTQPGKKGNSKVIPVLAAIYNPGSNSDLLVLRGFKPKRPLQLMASGLTGANGAAVVPIITNL
jgi:hypothetical protein